MSDFDDDIDDLVAALQARGWDKPLSTGAVSKEDEAVVAKLFGATNARRAVSTPKGRKLRMVRTTEVYAVENSRGWILGAIEGGRRKIIDQDLPWDECKRGLKIAEDHGFHVAKHNNPVRERQQRPATYQPWEQPAPSRPGKPSTPSKHVQPTKARDILAQLSGYKP